MKYKIYGIFISKIEFSTIKNGGLPSNFVSKRPLVNETQA